MLFSSIPFPYVKKRFVDLCTDFQNCLSKSTSKFAATGAPDAPPEEGGQQSAESSSCRKREPIFFLPRHVTMLRSHAATPTSSGWRQEHKTHAQTVFRQWIIYWWKQFLEAISFDRFSPSLFQHADKYTVCTGKSSAVVKRSGFQSHSTKFQLFQQRLTPGSTCAARQRLEQKASGTVQKNRKTSQSQTLHGPLYLHCKWTDRRSSTPTPRPMVKEFS